MNRRATSHAFGQGEIIDIDLSLLRDEFRSLRRQRHVSQADVAGLLKVSQATISSFEQGRHTQVRSKTLLQIYKIVAFWRGENALGVDGPIAQRSVVSLDSPHTNTESTCSHCGNPIPLLETPALFCPSCGTTLKGDCPCGHATHDRAATFCSRCGSPLGGRATNDPPAIPDTSRELLVRSLTRWLEQDPQIGRLFAPAEKTS